MATQRLIEKIRRDFSQKEAETLLELLDELGAYGDEPDPVGRERVQAANRSAAHGDCRRFLGALALAQSDWRDVLVASGLADEDWPEHLTGALAS